MQSKKSNSALLYALSTIDDLQPRKKYTAGGEAKNRVPNFRDEHTEGNLLIINLVLQNRSELLIKNSTINYQGYLIN
jgi:hypothetical protein